MPIFDRNTKHLKPFFLGSKLLRYVFILGTIIIMNFVFKKIISGVRLNQEKIILPDKN